MKRFGTVIGAGAALVIGFVFVAPSAALAADSPSRTTGVSVTAPQTASLPAEPSAAPTVTFKDANAIDLNINEFRSNLPAPLSTEAQLLPGAPTAPASTEGPKGARLVPLLRMTQTAEEPQNHGDFAAKHEFGIELKSDF